MLWAISYSNHLFGLQDAFDVPSKRGFFAFKKRNELLEVLDSILSALVHLISLLLFLWEIIHSLFDKLQQGLGDLLAHLILYQKGYSAIRESIVLFLILLMSHILLKFLAVLLIFAYYLSDVFFILNLFFH